ncbi:polysaccharide deacetylase family protein [Kiritimatiellaeota bacterium B1221]|nr:polysaccharide deacetylase family protein [Kiritimatiellaeota bacterium B1221]
MIHRPWFFIFPILSFLFPLHAADVDLRFYTREIIIQDAGNAGELVPCPVLDNKDFAFTARWDDSNPKHYRMQELMQKYGFKGTFFLNHKPDHPPMNFIKLKALQADLGAHSMTHARLASELTINRMFWEVAEIRAIIEAEGDRPINAYCFSDGNYRNDVRKNMQGLIAESLQRVGYTHNVSPKFAKSLPANLDPVSTVYYCTAGNDRNPSLEHFEKTLQERLANPEWQNDEPCLSMGVHVWMSNQKAWDSMEAVYQKYGGKENWWYCSQTEYAAYQKLLQTVEISSPQKRGNDLVYQVQLPYAADIGSDVALTLCYSGSATGIRMDDAPLPYRSQKGKYFFHVSPPAFAGTPKKISYQPMSKEDAPILSDTPNETAIDATLQITGEHSLSLNLTASEKSEIKNLQVRYILPPKYASPPVATITAPVTGTSVTHPQELHEIASGEFSWGKPFLLCQIDYLNHGQPERVFTSLFEPTVLPPENMGYRDQSWVSTFFSDRKIWEDALPMSNPEADLMPALKWIGASDAERLVFNENISDMGERLREELKTQTDETNYFIIITDFESPKAGRLISRSYKHSKEVYLNGKKLSPKNGEDLIVRQGPNRLVSLHKVTKFTGRMHHSFTYEVRNP